MTTKTKDISAGELRFPVSVQKPVYTNDNAGGQGKPKWETKFEIYCKVEDKKSSEQYSDGSTGRVRGYSYFLFTSWWREDIEITDRLLFRGKLFNIRGINNIEQRNKFIEITSESGVEQ